MYYEKQEFMLQIIKKYTLFPFFPSLYEWYLLLPDKMFKKNI